MATTSEERALLDAQLALLIDTTFKVLAQLTGVRTHRAGWLAECPCCRVQALTIGLSEYGFANVGLTCAAGCDPARLYAAVGLPPPQRWLM